MADPTTTVIDPEPSTLGSRVAFSIATLQHPAFYVFVGMALTVALIYAVKKGKL